MSETGIRTDQRVIDLTTHRMGLVVQKARQIREASDAFLQTWAPLSAQPAMPVFAWSELERQLLDLAPDELAPMVRDLVSALRKEAPPKPPEMVLREMLVIASTVLDESFRQAFAETTPEPNSSGKGPPMP
ncbi:hypothetical protein BH10PSE4_BH10PSE4_20740 [soil metagenome]